MLPRLFEIPLLSNPVVLSWTVFSVIVLVFIAFLTAAPKLGEKSKLGGMLMTWVPVAVFATAFLLFLQMPDPIGKVPLNTYGFSIMTGFLLATWFAVRKAKPLGIKSDFILDVGIIGMIFGVIGAKINYLSQYYEPPQAVLRGDLREVWGDFGLNPLGAVLGIVPFALWRWRIKTTDGPVKLYSWLSAALLVVTLLAAVLGARSLYVFQHRTEYSFSIFKEWQSGFVLYGGLIAGSLASISYIRLRGYPVFQIADISAGPVMLAQAFGRLGCFLNGCCWGARGDAFTCVTFPEGSAVFEYNRSHGLENGPVHPTQLYETSACLVFFGFLMWLGRRPPRVRGEHFFIMMMLYGWWRFAVEFIRGDERPNWIGNLSYSQVISLFAIILASVWLYVLYRRKGSSAPPGEGGSKPEAAPPEPQGSPA